VVINRERIHREQNAGSWNMESTWTGTGWQANGTLGVRGIQFPVDLAITVEDTESTEIIGVLITTAFNRKPIGIRAPIFVIGRNIEVTVRATFSRVAPGHPTDRLIATTKTAGAAIPDVAEA
jgi:hypothetical protein